MQRDNHAYSLYECKIPRPYQNKRDDCNDCFVSIGHTLAGILHNMNVTEESLAAKVAHVEGAAEYFFLFPMNAEEVDSSIRLLTTEGAPSLDGLSNQVLKVTIKSIMVLLVQASSVSFKHFYW